LSKKLPEIAEQIRKHKRVSEWKDEDETIRYTKLNIMSKAQIREMIIEYRMGKSVTKIAKDSKYGWRRVNKLFKFL